MLTDKIDFQIDTLHDLKQAMLSTVQVRRRIVRACLNENNINSMDVDFLKTTYELLLAVLEKNSFKCKLPASPNSDIIITCDISYEITELEKDISFLHSPQKSDFVNTLIKNGSVVENEMLGTAKFIKQNKITHFVTDRDGTINNYAGHYATSVQSVYNAVFLTTFIATLQNAIVITSAPLLDVGLIDISVSPQNNLIYAGSKGFEYQSADGIMHRAQISEPKLKLLQALNIKLKELLSRPQYSAFKYIGSGFQKKYGQTTIAYQDKFKSMSEELSKTFVDEIKSIVNQTDNDRQFFVTEETGTDLEILLTNDSQNLQSKKFKDNDKGDGINFIIQSENLNLKNANILVCGDTKSDLPLIDAIKSQTPHVFPLFVSTDADFKQMAMRESHNIKFVSTPDTLITALNKSI